MTRLLQWFGAATETGPRVGELLAGCRWVGIPFGGAVSEVPYITASTILVSDLHRHAINLCQVVADPSARATLIKRADAMPYHPDILYEQQEISARWVWSYTTDHMAALAYFVCSWMGRGGKCGTSGELTGELPIRYNGNGGGSNRRYRTAIEGLDAWGEAFRRCEFVCLDAFEFLAKPVDKPGNGLYLDPPWPGAGDEYVHKFPEADQRRLADVLGKMTTARIVIRYGEHPLVRELYQESDGWKWIELTSRDQANQRKAEVLITKRCKE